MIPNIVVVGLGQLGEIFSRGFLRAGHAVIPVTRSETLDQRINEATRLILVAVGEDSLSEVLASVPKPQLGKVILIQNELRPPNWVPYYLANGTAVEPTICLVWFEKKEDRPPVVVLPSVLCGDQSKLMEQAFHRLDLPVRTIHARGELVHELCLKNLYILGLNLSGLRGAQVAGELISLGPPFASLLEELIALERAGLASAGWKHELDAERLKKDLIAAFEADPQHGCAGRTARARLARTLQLGVKWGVALPQCQLISKLVNS